MGDLAELGVGGGILVIAGALAKLIHMWRGSGDKRLESSLESQKLKQLSDAQEYSQSMEAGSHWRSEFKSEQAKNENLQNRLLDLVARDSAHSEALIHQQASIERLKFRADTCEADRTELQSRVKQLEKRLENDDEDTDN